MVISLFFDFHQDCGFNLIAVSFCLQRGEMTSFTVLTKEELEQELSPEEIEEQDACVGQEIKEVNSPFGNFLRNLLCGGGRERKAKVDAGELDVNDDPTVQDGKLCGQNFEELRQGCLDNGELFTDPEFPPDDQSLYFSQETPYAFEWMRASEITDSPLLFEGGATRFDINQGELGDCWLLAALANLTLNKRLLYQGMF